MGLQKSFNTVKLLKKLSLMGLCSEALKWFASFVSHSYKSDELWRVGSHTSFQWPLLFLNISEWCGICLLWWFITPAVIIENIKGEYVLGARWFEQLGCVAGVMRFDVGLIKRDKGVVYCLQANEVLKVIQYLSSYCCLHSTSNCWKKVLERGLFISFSVWFMYLSDLHFLICRVCVEIGKKDSNTLHGRKKRTASTVKWHFVLFCFFQYMTRFVCQIKQRLPCATIVAITKISHLPNVQSRGQTIDKYTYL